MSMQPAKPLLSSIDERAENNSNIMYIRIEPALLYLEAGQTSKIKVYAVLTDGRNEEITEKVKWHSQHTTNGKVNEEGIITAIEAGSMMIMAEYEQHKAELVVSIEKKETVQKEKNTGLIVKVGAISLAAFLALSGVVYGAVQLFSHDESAVEVQEASTDPAPASSPVEKINASPSVEENTEEEPSPTEKIESSVAAEEATEPSEQNAEVPTTEATTDEPQTDVLDKTKQSGAALTTFLQTLANGQANQTETTATPPVGATGSLPESGQTQAQSANGETNVTAKPNSAVTTKTPTPVTKAEQPKKVTPPKKQTVTRTTSTQSAVKPQPKPVGTQQPAVKPKPVATTVSQPKPPATTSVMLVPVEKAGKWGYKRAGEDEVTIPYNFDHATKFSDGLALVKKDGKFGYINAKGQVVIPFEYSYATSFSGGKATVKKDGKLGTIDKTGSFSSN